MSAGKNVFEVAATFVSEGLGAADVPFTGGAKAIADKYIAQRQEIAREAYIAEVGQGFHAALQLEPSDIDPLIAMMLRLMSAATSGVARDNLRFMAQVIAGLKKKKALEFDNFSRWANILEALTRSELLAVGLAWRCQKAVEAAAGANTFWEDYERMLKEAGFDEKEVAPICASVARYGILVPVSAWSSTIYYPSPWLTDLAELADLQAMSELKPG